ncbi:MAG TPA: polysaccharide biosynthesis C-terminal domain-containing protein [Chryseolinea sp.]
MSAAARLISGSVASWAQIAVNIVAQIILVPIYLNYWSVQTYGIWLAIQGIMSALSMLDLGHQNFMGYEFLRIGRQNLPTLSKYFASAVIIGILISIVQVLLTLVFMYTGILPFLLGESGSENATLITSAGVALVLQALLWLLLVTVSGLMVRLLAAFGYFPRTAWWGFLYAIITALAPLIAVVLGADLLTASLALTGTCFIYGIFLYIDLFRAMKRERIRILKPSLPLGYSNFRKSLPLLGKSLFENVRQQGVRLVLAPIAGPAALAAFATMRTGANVALQGLNTIVNPILPDLMRFLHDRDQPRSEAAFSTIWIVVVAVMAPGVVILQLVMEPFFVFWTQGKIPFDPLLFAALSVGVLVYAVIQPAMAVVIGNNLAKLQLGLAAIGALIVFGVLILSVPVIGILGAAVALLLAEIAAAVGYKIYAKRWLRSQQLEWPSRPFRLAVTSVAISAVALLGLVFKPEFKWAVLAVAMLLFAWNFWRYWLVLPSVALESAKNIIKKIPGLKRMVFYLRREFKLKLCL